MTEVKVKRYKKKDGTVVKGSTRNIKKRAVNAGKAIRRKVYDAPKANRLSKKLLKVNQKGMTKALNNATENGKLGMNSKKALKRINSDENLALISGMSVKKRNKTLSNLEKVKKRSNLEVKVRPGQKPTYYSTNLDQIISFKRGKDKKKRKARRDRGQSRGSKAKEVASNASKNLAKRVALAAGGTAGAALASRAIGAGLKKRGTHPASLVGRVALTAGGFAGAQLGSRAVESGIKKLSKKKDEGKRKARKPR